MLVIVRSKTKIGIAVCACAMAALITAYVAYMGHVVMNASLQANIVYSVHGDDLIPSIFARTYFMHSQKIVHEIKDATFPVIPFTVGGIYSGKSISQHKWTFELLGRELAFGADINASQSGFTALHSAVLSNDPVTLKFLLEHGANSEIKSRPGPFGKPNDAVTPLELAVNLQAKYPSANYAAVIALLRDQVSK